MPETAKYRITGLVEIDGAICEVGSVQEFSLEEGSKCVDAATCELVVEETADEAATETGETGDSEVDETETDADTEGETGSSEETEVE